MNAQGVVIPNNPQSEFNADSTQKGPTVDVLPFPVKQSKEHGHVHEGYVPRAGSYSGVPTAANEIPFSKHHDHRAHVQDKQSSLTSKTSQGKKKLNTRTLSTTSIPEH